MDYQFNCIKAGYDCLKCKAVECIGHQIANMPSKDFESWQDAQKPESEEDRMIWAGIIAVVK